MNERKMLDGSVLKADGYSAEEVYLFLCDLLARVKELTSEGYIVYLGGIEVDGHALYCEDDARGFGIKGMGERKLFSETVWDFVEIEELLDSIEMYKPVEHPRHLLDEVPSINYPEERTA